MVYTSGTTGPPKGVVLTHSNLEAQMAVLSESWGWRFEDRITNVLPLHHLHGINNVLGCGLWNGATVAMPGGPFDARRTWESFPSSTVFMAVPTVYSKLVKEWESRDDDERRELTRTASQLRLMVSGSAALPEPVMAEWERVSTHVLLERYGMTEIGMALSNPLHGERRPGKVGTPLPSGSEKRVMGSHHSLERGSPVISLESPRVSTTSREFPLICVWTGRSSLVSRSRRVDPFLL